MSYNPHSTDRKVLADAILALMARSIFTEESRPGTREKVFAREVPDTDGKVRVLVYTSIEGDMTRECGDDAIRVCAVYKARDGFDRGIASAEKRVNRTGEITSITDRLIERMREVWKATKTAEKCSKCGAPMFKTKAGKLCCADLCWKRAEDLNRDSRSSRYNSHYSYRSAVPAGASLPASWENAPLAKQVAFMMAAGGTSGYDWDAWADREMGDR